MMNRLYFRHKSSNKSRSSVSSLEENNEDIGDVPDQKNDKWNDLRRTKSLMEKFMQRTIQIVALQMLKMELSFLSRWDIMTSNAMLREKVCIHLTLFYKGKKMK